MISKKISSLFMSIGAIATFGATAFGEAYLRYNQVGYAPDRDKKAIVISDSALTGQSWSLTQGAAVVATGTLGDALERPVKSNPSDPTVEYSSHPFNYELDFSTIKQQGDYTLSVGNLTSGDLKIKERAFDSLLPQVLRTMRVQRSGTDQTLLHPACHMGDSSVIAYRPDGPLSNGAWAPDPAGKRFDMLGGWYDAGDYIKFTLNNALTAYNILRSYQLNPIAFDFNEFQEPGQETLIDVLDEAKFGLEFLMKTHPEPDEFIIQVSTGADHDTWRLCQDDTRDGQREGLTALSPVHMSITAAALALGSQVFADVDPTLAASYQAKAESIYARMRQILAPSDYPADFDSTDTAAAEAFYAPYIYFERDEFNDFYWDKSVADDQALAAVELYALTGIQSYLDDARAYSELAGQGFFASWSEVHMMENLRLGEFDTRARNRVVADLDAHVVVGNDVGNVWGIPQVPIWGAVANYMYVVGAAAEAVANGDTYYEGLLYDTMDYIVGRNNWGTSFILSQDIPNSSQNIYGQLYDSDLHGQPIFGTGTLAGGPGSFDFINAIPTSECANAAPPNPFNTPDMGYFDVKCNFVTMEYTLFGQSTLLYGLSSMTAMENTPGCNFNPNQVDARKSPPGCLRPSEVPMFISLGIDDNSHAAGVDWIVNHLSNRTNPVGTGNPATYDGTPMSATFFNTSFYAGTAGSSWKAAYNAGFEQGNHTVNHTDKGYDFSHATWSSEIGGANDSMVSLGIPLNEIYGFRAPRLQHNDDMFTVLQEKGHIYDSSIQEGWAFGQDGTNFNWPYTLDNGSPGAQILLDYQFPNAREVLPHPGLWEMPAYPFIIPPDEKDGFPYSLLAKVQAEMPYIADDGKITGFDYNLIELAKLSKEEILAIFKHTLDLRLEGNRAPMLIGAHSINFANPEKGMSWVTEQFLDYAVQHPDVRVVSYKQTLDWIKGPNNVENHTISASAGAGGTITPSGNVSVTDGSNLTFHFVPDVGYFVVDILVDGVSQGTGPSYEFVNVTGDHTISVLFETEIAPLTITASAGPNGSINPSGTIFLGQGSNLLFNATPDPGYEIDKLYVDGVDQGPITSYLFDSIIANHTISVTFKPIEIRYTITASVLGSGGTISPAGGTVVGPGQNMTYTIIPDPGYRIKDVQVDGVSQGAISTLTISNITSDHTVTAEFELIVAGVTATYNITQDWGSGFCANVVLNNSGSSDKNGWTVTWTFPSGQTVSSLWNANYTQTGANVSVSDLGWNGTIAAGASVSFGLCGAYSGSNVDPSDITVQ